MGNEEKEKTLVDVDKYLKTGAHIGTKHQSGDMKRYIYKVRKDGLKVMSVPLLDERIKIAAKFLASFPADKIAVVSRKVYGQTPVKVFADVIGAKAFLARFVPGTLTNPNAKTFFEANAVVVTEPESDWQAIKEACRIRVPVVALCSINNSLKDIDVVIPVNNKGRQSLALVYWLLATDFLLASGEIKSKAEFKKTMDDFEYKLKEGELAEGEERQQQRFARGSRTDYKGRPRMQFRHKFVSRPPARRPMPKPEAAKKDTAEKEEVKPVKKAEEKAKVEKKEVKEAEKKEIKKVEKNEAKKVEKKEIKEKPKKTEEK